MIDSQDISEQELEVLKGDTVGGNNLCSSKWLINTLMSLCQVHENGWTKELESQLCILWDLSMEEEVVSYLISYDFLKIAKKTLVASDEPRLIEIILGIIGNICCNKEAIDTIACDQELVTQILRHLASEDSLILIQLLRILQLIVCKIWQNPESDWIVHFTECEFLGDSITFMLMSSTNNDLLLAAMNFLESVSKISLPHENSFLKKLFKIDNLIPALLESFMQVISTEKDGYSEVELTFIRHWLIVLIVIIESNSLKFEDYENDENFLKLMEIMYRILEPYKKSYNLYPMQRSSIDIITNTLRILLSFHCCDVNIPPKIDHIIGTLIITLETGMSSSKKYDLEAEEQIPPSFLDFMIKYWLQINKLCTSEQIVEILCLCTSEVSQCLMILIQNDSKTTLEMHEKVENCRLLLENLLKKNNM
ncbi:hypothetical protein P5V15_002213 [Pogonomyrmex californicus]